MKKALALTAVIGLALTGAAVAQPPRGPGRPPRDDGVVKAPSGEGIAWYATLESGLNEAKRTGKPILFLAAAPHCGGVSGIW